MHSAAGETLKMIKWSWLKRIIASYDFHEGSRTRGCVENDFFVDVHLGEIFAYRKKQCIFNACVIFGTFWGEGVRRGESILILSRVKDLQDLCTCWMLKGKSILVLLGLDIKAFLSHFDIMNIKTWCKTDTGHATSSHMGFFFPLSQHYWFPMCWRTYSEWQGWRTQEYFCGLNVNATC